MIMVLIKTLDSAFPILATRWQQCTGIDDPEYFIGIQKFVILTVATALFHFIWFMEYANNVGLIAAVMMCLCCYNMDDTTRDYQRSQMKVMFYTSLWCLCFDTCTLVPVVLALISRFSTSDYFVAFYFKRINQVAFLVNGKVVPKRMLNKVKIHAFADEAVKNRCGWEALFIYPDLARYHLNTRDDGRLTSKLLRSLVEEGLVRVVIDDSLYLHDHIGNAVLVRVVGDHMTDLHRPPSKKTDKWEMEESFGVVLPKIRPEPVKRLLVRDQMAIKCDELNSLREQDSIDGRMAECAHLAAREELDVLDEIASKPLMENLTPTEISNYYLTNRGWHVYNTVSKRWIGRPKSSQSLEATIKFGRNARPPDPNMKDTNVDPDEPWDFDNYALAWSGHDFLCVEWQGKHVKTVWTMEQKVVKPAYILLIDKLKYRRGAAYLDRAFSLFGRTHTCDVILEEGVPSCGKTHSIVTRSMPRDLITLPGREGAKEYLELGKTAVTIDSIIVNGWNGPNSETLWVDEGLLAHCGSIEMAIQILKPSIVRVFGDRNQLPFYPRVANYKLEHKEYPWTTEPLYHSKAYRNPRVVCDMLRPLYPRGYEWANDVEGFMEVIHTTNAGNVKTGHDVFLTYRQDEKTMLAKLLPAGSNIMTIHESQGLRFRDVALVRLKINDLDIYKSLPHHIVAVSRAHNSFTYYTCKPDDALSKWVGKRSKPGVFSGDQKLFKGQKYAIMGGAYTASRNRVVKFADPEPSEGYEEWLDLLCHVIPATQPTSLPYVINQVNRRVTKWNSDSIVMPTAQVIQAQYDGMFRRRNLDIAKGDRLIWPIKWFPGVRINFGKVGKKPQLTPRPAIRPTLITTQAPRAMKHPLDVKEAMEKRVVAPPKQQLNYTPDLTVKLVEAFMKNVDSEKLDELNLRIRSDTRELRKLWWNTRDTRRKTNILKSEPHKMNGMKYFCAPRPDHKVKTDNSHPDTVEPGQLISAHSIFWTSVFAPYFQSLLFKMLGCMKDYIVLHTRITWEELSDIIDNRLSGKLFQALELDISKFDKSQLRSVLEAQCEIMRKFHVPEDIIQLWQSFHEMCVLEASVDGVSFKVAFQRRSGDSLTWLGNTMVLLMVMGHLYDLEKTCLTLLSGDDNLACFELDYELKDQSRKAAEELNFEIKTFCFKNTMYFSSRFIICTKQGWMIVADPIKVISRLGRSDIQGRDHLHEIYNSFRALHYMYRDKEIRLLLDEAVTARYNSILATKYKSMMVFIEAIAAIVEDYNNLENLFSGTDEEWNLKLDPNEKIGEQLYRDAEPVFEDEHFQ